MEELYVEGLATHGGPESCVASRKGRGEALTGARIGRAMEPRNVSSGVLTLSKRRKATPWAALARAAQGPARSGNQGMCGTFMRENRESPCLPVRLVSGRAVQGTSRR
jgi:RNA-directed DNA polymerase